MDVVGECTAHAAVQQLPTTSEPNEDANVLPWKRPHQDQVSSWKEQWERLHGACKLLIIFSVAFALQLLASAVLCFVYIDDVKQELYVPLAMLVTVLFYWTVVCKAVFRENTMLLVTAILLQFAVLARTIGFILYRLGTLGAWRWILSLVLAATTVIILVFAFFTYRKFGWRMLCHLQLDLRRDNALYVRKLWLAGNLFAALLHTAHLSTIILAMAGICSSVNAHEDDQQGSFLDVPRLVVNVAGLLYNSVVGFMAYRLASKDRQHQYIWLVDVLAMFSFVMPVANIVLEWLRPPQVLNSRSTIMVCALTSMLCQLGALLLFHRMQCWWSQMWVDYQTVHLPYLLGNIVVPEAVYPLLKGSWVSMGSHIAMHRKKRFFQLSRDLKTLRWSWVDSIAMNTVDCVEINTLDGGGGTITFKPMLHRDVTLMFEDQESYDCWRLGLQAVFEQAVLEQRKDDKEVLVLRGCKEVHPSPHQPQNHLPPSFLQRLWNSCSPFPTNVDDVYSLSSDVREDGTGEQPVVGGCSALSMFLLPDVRLPLLESFIEEYDEKVYGTLFEIADLQIVHTSLGSGGQADVHLAKYKDTHVAVKAFNVSMKRINDDSNNEKVVRATQVEMLHEIKMHSALTGHTHIVKMLGVCPITWEGTVRALCVVMEYCGSGSLAGYMNSARQQQPALEPRKLLSVALSIAKGIQYLHSKHILHGDVKPGNVLVGPGQIMKLSDFGHSCDTRIVGADESHLWRCSTPLYSAPECCVKQNINNVPPSEIILKSDVYAFGVTLWELMNGQSPYPDISGSIIQLRKLESVDLFKLKPFAMPDQCGAGYQQLYRQIDDLVRHCTLRDPKQRPSIQDVIHTLELLKDRTSSLKIAVETQFKALQKYFAGVSRISAQRSIGCTV